MAGRSRAFFRVLLWCSTCVALNLEALAGVDARPPVETDPMAVPHMTEDEVASMGPNSLWQTPSDCGEMGVWDVSMAMCMPLPMPEMPMRMLMLHGNLYGSRIWQSGSRGRDDWVSTNMVMADLGTTVGVHHYLNLDLMLTAELWTVPSNGYPLLLQIGEKNSQGIPFIDAQHPHSSPVMGLTFSDTISLGHEKDHLKLFFAPRGEASDGPVAFMHRATGLVNPDAPLGHHIGQDVGHISSTVIGSSLKLQNHRIEFSIFSGAEPSPAQVDLPLGVPDSFSLRYINEFSAQWMGMVSFARVNAPEPDEPDILFENRYSASVYTAMPVSPAWTFYNTLIYGLVTHYDHSPFLSSFGEELLLKGDSPRIWGRFEILQRTRAELSIPATGDSYAGLWISALTLGYSHQLASWGGTELMLGGSITENILPQELSAAYGGNPWAGKIFLQLGGMQMWSI